jgi:hypothetical protein
MAQSYATFIVFLAWISFTFPRPPSKRAVAIAFINSFGQLGNVTDRTSGPRRGVRLTDTLTVFVLPLNRKQKGGTGEGSPQGL